MTSEPSAQARVVVSTLLLLLLAGAGVGAYLTFKRPGDVSNSDVAFERSQPGPKKVKGQTSWPIYGYTKARTRYMPAANVKPPFKRIWSFTGSVLLEFSPILVGDTLYVIKNTGGLYALNADTGNVRWARKLGHKNASSPAYENGRLFTVNLHPPQATALRARTGKRIWRKRLPGRSESSPVTHAGKVYFGCECGLLYAVSQRTGKTIWTRRLAGPIKASPALYKNSLYVGDYGGRLWAINTRDGSVKWSTGSRGGSFGRGGNFYSTPAVAFGRVYVGSTDGRVYSASLKTGKLAWTHSTGGYVYAAPAVASTPRTPPTVYIGSYDGNFYALDARTGRVRWRHRAGGRISGAASVIGETVYFSNLAAKSTTGLSARTGRPVYRISRGAFNPAISDGRRLYITGYSSIYAFKPTRGRGK